MKKLILIGAIVAVVMSTGVAVGGCSTPRQHVAWKDVEIKYDLRYGSRGDAPGEGTVAYSNKMSRVRHDGHVMHTHRTGQFYDLVRMKGTLAGNAPVYVNLHGGAWCDICDKDGENFLFLAELARMGFVVVNMNYQLQEPLFNPRTGARMKERPNASFDDMLRDIDQCVSHVKNELAPSLGIRPRAIVIGGGSAGAHLSCLYAYDQSCPEKLGLKLKHDLPVGFVVDIVGPSDLASEDFSKPLLEKSYELGSFLNEEVCDRMVPLFGYLVKADLRAMAEKGDLEGARRILARYSPINLINPKVPPTVLAYCRVLPWSRGDGCIPASTYYDHCRRLKENGVPYEGDIRSWRIHGWLREDYMWWLLDRIEE